MKNHTTQCSNTAPCNKTAARRRTTKNTNRATKTRIPKGHIVRSLRDILGESVQTRSKVEMLALAKMGLNTSRYEVMDTVGRTSQILLRPRYWNVRDEQGRFATA